MPFLGSTPPVNYKTLTKQTITGDSSTAYTLNEAVANANEIEVFVNNVRQQPTTDYTASSKTITFTDPLLSSDSCWLVYQGKAESTTIAQTGNIADGAVTSAKIDTNIDIAGTLDVTSTLTADNGVNVAGVGSVTNSGSNLAVNTTGSYLVFQFSGTEIFGMSTVAGKGFYPSGDNVRDLGQASYRWNDIYLGGGAYIGGTTSANYLDDYEEGTWTATIREHSTSTTVSYSNQTCYYTKVGRLVTLNAYIGVSSHNGTTSNSLWRIYGFPFTPTNDYGAIMIYENSNASQLGSMRFNVGSYGALGSLIVPSSAYLHFTATYAIT